MTVNDHGRPPDASRYEIRLGGHLAPRWVAWFDGMTLTRADDSTTVLTGPVVDQAALHGLLRKVRDLGLPLLAVTQIDPIQPHVHQLTQSAPEGIRTCVRRVP